MKERIRNKLKSGLGLASPYQPEWKKEWKGMPEFVQEDLRPFQTLSVHFRDKEDAKAFGELVGQKITSKTKSIWYPRFEREKITNLRYVDEK